MFSPEKCIKKKCACSYIIIISHSSSLIWIFMFNVNSITFAGRKFCPFCIQSQHQPLKGQQINEPNTSRSFPFIGPKMYWTTILDFTLEQKSKCGHRDLQMLETCIDHKMLIPALSVPSKVNVFSESGVLEISKGFHSKINICLTVKQININNI